ncbi:hypothetical protein PK35_00100 [Tamlana nanhaiensis]|uniref:Secretion system C-terminal sorting domain-containing protein n=1 Tax=Neotamlana nanhaiensis TaxID=1382798 RepID=A0A0D7W5H0_9FLAO|nr:T9SS type A sorting domain-containing protein [Tamlana nanhaiensis]KJD34269.1 hypothetical protein PK35_00100 [Tamlana nanhaiensis]
MPNKLLTYFLFATLCIPNVNAQANTQDSRIKLWLSFTDPNAYKRLIGLGYDQNTTHNYDNGYDARSFNDNQNEMYWVMNNENLSIMALPEFNENEELPLGVTTYTAGNFNFELNKTENFPENIQIFLKDKQTNSEYNLSTETAIIWLDETVNTTRFSIIFQPTEESSLSIDRTTALESIKMVYQKENKRLSLTHLDVHQLKAFSIYNTAGKKVLAKNKEMVNPEISINALKNGMYFLNIATDVGIKSFKFIKH